MRCGKNRKDVKWQIIFFSLAIVITLASSNILAQNQGNFTASQYYDFTPGDTVIFYDDFSADDVGAFPEVWDQITGECKVVDANDRSWLIASEDSEVDPYLESPLPAAFAVEFTANILRDGQPGHWVVAFLDAAQKQEAEFSFDSRAANFITPSGAASSFEQNVEGHQRIAVMFQDGRFKCYIGKQRVIDAATAGFEPASMRIGMFAAEGSQAQQAMFTDFRITQKSGAPQQLLYENRRWVCYGVYFDFGKATLRDESFPTLQQLGELMKKDPRLNIRIEDHSNDQEDDSNNMRLSQDRAEVLKDYLMETFNLTKDRLQTKGWGAGMPIGPTETPDGWEMNRRVEFIKI
jgi:outer membrane protein OmpA-like peptidoglycan-associated protein